MKYKRKRTQPRVSRDEPIAFDDAAMAIILAASPPLPKGAIKIPVPNTSGGRQVKQRMGRRRALQYSLNRAARLWEIYSAHIPYESHRHVAQEARRAASAADRLLSIFVPEEVSEVLRTDDLADWTRDLHLVRVKWDNGDPGAGSRFIDLDTLLNEVLGLRDWAIEIEKKAGDFGPTPRSERREPDYARDVVLKALLRIWRDIFERPIRISNYPQSAPPGKRGNATGPLIRFLEACIPYFNGFPEQNPNRLRDHVKRLKSEL